MHLYKVTDGRGQTMGSTQWGEGVTHEASGRGTPLLCSDRVIHAYIDPLVATFMEVEHTHFCNPLLWIAEGEIVVRSPTKVGCHSLTTIRRIDFPKVTTDQRVAFGILCALEVCDDPVFVEWAHKWMSGTDRTSYTAEMVTSYLMHNSSNGAAVCAANAVVYAPHISSHMSAARAAELAGALKRDLDAVALAAQAVELLQEG